ncbi:MAG TPA: Uma2 family endonuclease [Bryobacteraceae bacterium]|nr:Uma2 family endonuclease [Bryobacteraceae bacterium]
MTPSKTLLTAEEFDNYPFEEDKRYELDEGELIEMTRPAYWHNEVLEKLQFALGSYLRQTRVGILLISENLYALSALTRRTPDVAVILGDRRAELRNAKVIHIIPEIVVEVLSPNETTRTIHRKLKQYFAAGVKEVWLVDPEAREAEIWAGPTLPESAFTEADVLVSALLPGFALPLKELFV